MSSSCSPTNVAFGQVTKTVETLQTTFVETLQTTFFFSRAAYDYVNSRVSREWTAPNGITLYCNLDGNHCNLDSNPDHWSFGDIKITIPLHQVDCRVILEDCPTWNDDTKATDTYSYEKLKEAFDALEAEIRSVAIDLSDLVYSGFNKNFDIKYAKKYNPYGHTIPSLLVASNQATVMKQVTESRIYFSPKVVQSLKSQTKQDSWTSSRNDIVFRDYP
jgi:hypothetical protein